MTSPGRNGTTRSAPLVEELRADFARFAQMFAKYDLTDAADIESIRETLLDLALDAHELAVEVRRD